MSDQTLPTGRVRVDKGSGSRDKILRVVVAVTRAGGTAPTMGKFS